MGPLLAGSIIPFALVFYLALRGGGYDPIVRSEVGVVIWWTILIGAIIGILPTARLTRRGLAALVLLSGLTVWTGAAIIWSESAERSAIELGRVASLLGVFALALATQGEGFLCRSVKAIGAAVAAIALLALVSRFHPSWFPANQVAEVLPTERARLNYPLTYWNGLAALLALGSPLLVWTATEARTIAGRALAAAVLPALALTVFFTISRGGLLEAAVALGVLAILHPQRLRLVPVLVLGAGGGALLILAASGRNELADGLTTAAAVDQGTEMALITLAVCIVVGSAHAAVSLAERHGKLPLPHVSRRAAWAGAGAGLVTLVLAITALGLSGKLGERWEEFRQPVTPGASADRFASASGSGRYQWWRSAVDASATEPLLGIGPGTFELWWSRDPNATLGPVRDAHSLYLEMLAELGIVGLLLILGLIGLVVAASIVGTLRHRHDRERTALLAAATASVVAFAAAAAIDWVWELTVLPTIFLLLAAAILGFERGKPRRGCALVARTSFAAGATGALVVIAAPMLSASAIRRSQEQVDAGQLPAALTSARKAEDLLPFAASPDLQEALVLELAGELDPAADAAHEATENEPTNWRPWLVLSRIEAELGEVGPATDAYRRARSLNPRSSIFSD